MAQEPPAQDHKLFELDNLVITPHIAWHTEEAMERVEMCVAEDVVAVLAGREPKYLRNP